MAFLTVDPAIRYFSPDQEEEFVDHVREVDSRTTTVPIEEPEDIELGDDGLCRRDGFALSTLAFTQLCGCVASGLSTLAEDLAGMRLRRDRAAVSSIATACRIVNTCVDLRFRVEKGPYGRLMIRDTETNVIDGIVGPGYRYLPHCELYEGVREMLSALEPPAFFAGAQIIGRHLSLCMLNKQPLFTTKTGEEFYAGYYFANSEAGECSVGAASLLGLGGANERCIGGFTGMGKLSHSGKSFRKKLGNLLAGVLVDPAQAATLGACAGRLLDKPLAIVDENRIDKAKREQLVGQLHARGLARPVAKDVVRWALFAGAGGTSLPTHTRPQDVAGRTAFDVFVALMRRSTALHPNLRESLEQTAYHLLLGKFKLG